ncbi:uncharacterized protein MONOS_15409 [Monocercomonoides exilis]|uniref:uncharacterized protein n=1 Tax=Monocercomonoides exilis TaxID=2049356 RepID=UPI00355A89D2|nr:hypothetical protein MONOS_15409 [Monocercomonoides exilis]
MNTRRATIAPGETRSGTEMQKQQMNVRGTLNSPDQRKLREREITGDSAREISIEDVRHETTRTEGDSEYPRVTGQKSEREKGKIVLRAFGIVIEPPIGSAREGSSRTAILETLEEEGNTQTQPGHKTPGVRESIVIGPPKEPLPGRLVNRLSEWRKIGGDKLVSREKIQTRVSGDYGDDKQLFIPLGGGVEGRSGEAHTGVGGEVVQPDIHGPEEERKVEEDSGLQNCKRGSARETLQDGFPGDSCGTPGEERLDDHSGHIECIPGCIEIDLTGDSPVPEKFGLDTVRREAEIGAHRDTPREAEFCEVTTPTSELVDEAYEILAKAGNSPRRLERDCDSQPNVVRRVDTLEENPAREQTKESEKENKASSTYNRFVRAGMGCSVNNTDGEQRGEDICPRKMDPPGECVSDKRKGVQSSVEEITEKGSVDATAEDRSYLSEDRQYVHKMDNTEEEGSAIAHSNTESIGEETEQPGHNNTDGTSPGRTEYGSRCTRPDGEKAELCIEGGES